MKLNLKLLAFALGIIIVNNAVWTLSFKALCDQVGGNMMPSRDGDKCYLERAVKDHWRSLEDLCKTFNGNVVNNVCQCPEGKEWGRVWVKGYYGYEEKQFCVAKCQKGLTQFQGDCITPEDLGHACSNIHGQVVDGKCQSPSYCPKGMIPSYMYCRPDLNNIVKCSKGAGKCITPEESCRLECSQNRPANYNGAVLNPNGSCGCK